MVVDIGGFVKYFEDIFEVVICFQVQIVIEEVKVIIFMVDVIMGIIDFDEEVVSMFCCIDKLVYFVVNKVDNYNCMMEVNEFWSLGFENIYFLFLFMGSGFGDLLDLVVEYIEEKEEELSQLLCFVIVGQFNVGKFFLINVLLGEDCNIVIDIVGIICDFIYFKYFKFDKEFLFIDIVGICKKLRVYEDFEFYFVMCVIKVIEEADVCLLMIDV